MATDTRRCYSYLVFGVGGRPTQLIWVVAPSRETADATMLMECVGNGWTLHALHSEKAPGIFDPHLVDYWVGGKEHGD